MGWQLGGVGAGDGVFVILAALVSLAFQVGIVVLGVVIALAAGVAQISDSSRSAATTRSSTA